MEFLMRRLNVVKPEARREEESLYRPISRHLAINTRPAAGPSESIKRTKMKEESPRGPGIPFREGERAVVMGRANSAHFTLQ